MRRLVASLTSLLILSLVAGAVPEEVEAQVAVVKPNVLLIVTDDQRATGGTMKAMRATRRLIQRRGRRYPNAFATTPVCCPSRTSILTGQYTHNHGVKNNHKAERFDPSTAMPAHLQEAGYATGLFGKYLNEWQGDPFNFDRWAISKGKNWYYDGQWNVNGVDRTIDAYNADVIARRTIDFLEDLDASDDLAPWFAYVAPLGPHAPSTPAKRHRGARVAGFDGNPAVSEKDRTDKPAYVRRKTASLREAKTIATRQQRSLLAVDEMIQRVDTTLGDLQEKRNTLVVFLSDNGYSWAEHGLLGPTISKNTPYLQSSRIPMALRFPGSVSPKTRDRRLVANIDVAPTVYDAVGILGQIEHSIDGRSLLDPTWDRKRLLLERFNQSDVRVPPWATIQTKKAQYTEYRHGKSVTFREFYRLTQDPWQLQNLLHDGTRKNNPHWRRLHSRLVDLRNCKGTSGPNACP